MKSSLKYQMTKTKAQSCPALRTRKPDPTAPTGANQTHPTTGSYFLSLELENVRCFSSKQVLDLSDGKGRPARWTILLGENGTGKTTVLQLIAAFELMHTPMARNLIHSPVFPP